MGSSLGTPGPLRPPGPPEPSGPSDLLGSQDLRNLGELPLPFEIQNLNTQKLWNWSINKDLPKLYNWTIANQRGKFRVPSEVILFIELLTMIIRGQSPPLLPSNYVTVINRNYNQGHLIGYTWIEKMSQFVTLQYVQIYIKTPFFCYRYTKENKCFHYIRQINYSL